MNSPIVTPKIIRLVIWLIAVSPVVVSTTCVEIRAGGRPNWPR
jgi:hypothetical protein